MKSESEIQFNKNEPEPQMAGIKSLSISQACKLLLQAKIKGCNLLSNGSNYVFLLTMAKDGMNFRAIYKPCQGEIPLWDFPSNTLYKRELAAFIVSQALEWGLIPPTVIRGGPHGVGSVQWFIDPPSKKDNGSTTIEVPALKQVALFDILINNADRKAGHFLVDSDGRLWLVDHGLTFNSAPKLRTVLWDFSGQPVPGKLLADVRVLQSKLKPEKPLHDALRRMLNESEIKALGERINSILEKPVFVYPGPHRSVPWPWY
jgi:hypothetical protein